jgi:hypothetical protein
MTCEEAQSRMADAWAQSLTDADELALEAHLADCGNCRAEDSRLRGTWRDLALMPADEPSPRLRARFYEALSAYREGAAVSKRWQVWQIAAGIALLISGFGAGYLAHREPASEMKELREEVASMRQLVALSLLQQQGSASERLRGVSLAYQVEPSNAEVLSALVTAVNHDSNVNVRLAAVDALRNFAGSPVTRRAAVESLPQQDTPLVQVALIDLLVDINDRQAAPDLRKLADDTSVDDNVKERALWALKRFEQ